MFSRAGVFGNAGLLYTPFLMALTQSVLVLPIIISLSGKVIERAWQDYEDFFQSLCLSKYRAILVLIYEMRFALIRIGLAGFGRAIGEVGAVMIVGGNINHLTRVMTTAIAVETARGELSTAIALGCILILIAFFVNAAITFIGARLAPESHP
jgi:tungstate transport system permease protein